MNYQMTNQRIDKLEKTIREELSLRTRLFFKEATFIIGNCEDCNASSDIRLFNQFMRFLLSVDDSNDSAALFSNNRIVQICERLQNTELERFATKKLSPTKLISQAKYYIERQKVTISDKQEKIDG